MASFAISAPTPTQTFGIPGDRPMFIANGATGGTSAAQPQFTSAGGGGEFSESGNLVQEREPFDPTYITRAGTQAGEMVQSAKNAAQLHQQRLLDYIGHLYQLRGLAVNAARSLGMRMGGMANPVAIYQAMEEKARQAGIPIDAEISKTLLAGNSIEDTLNQLMGQAAGIYAHLGNIQAMQKYAAQRGGAGAGGVRGGGGGGMGGGGMRGKSLTDLGTDQPKGPTKDTNPLGINTLYWNPDGTPKYPSDASKRAALGGNVDAGTGALSSNGTPEPGEYPDAYYGFTTNADQVSPHGGGESAFNPSGFSGDLSQFDITPPPGYGSHPENAPNLVEPRGRTFGPSGFFPENTAPLGSEGKSLYEGAVEAATPVMQNLFWGGVPEMGSIE